MINRHAEAVSKAKLVLIVLCVFAIVVTFVVNHMETSAVDEHIRKIESPCLRYGPRSKECHEAFGAAIKSITPYQLCVLLSRQPELTGVKPSDCVRIAHEARRKQKAAQQTKRSSVAVAPARAPSPSAPMAVRPPTSGSASPPTTPVHKARPPRQPSPQSTPTPSAPAPQAADATTTVTPPAPTPPVSSPVAELKVPTLPAQVCVRGVANVNC